MSRPDRHVLAYAIVAAIVSAGFWILWIATDAAGALGLTMLIHLLSAGLTSTLVEPRRRGLALSLGIVVPVLGPLAAALSTLIGGRGGNELLHDPHATRAKLDGTEIARRLTHSMPVCEALSSSNADARRQALSKLKARGSAEDVAILRWARSQRSGDAAVEVALAFEELSSRFEQQASTARLAAANRPSYGSLSAAFLVLSAGITSGVVDPQLVGRVADEGARHHDAAVRLDPVRGQSLMIARVRLELAMHRPDEALAFLEGAGHDLPDDTDLGALYREAAYAARRFELVREMSRGRA